MTYGKKSGYVRRMESTFYRPDINIRRAGKTGNASFAGISA
jgi:hypothetical protein